jgi:hypothetical protein
MGCQRSLAMLAFALGLSALLGCSGTRIKAPKFDPAEAARQAMSEFDANKDGGLDADELAKCPGLLAAKDSIPPDANGRRTESAIAERLKAYQNTQQVIKAFSCQVLLDEQPVSDATVTLVPEKFLGPTFQGATGTTGQSGDAVVSAAEVRSKGFSGVYCGLYRVQISSRDPAGTERLPAQYNRETTLGLDVAPDGEPGRGCVFRLSSSSSGR